MKPSAIDADDLMHATLVRRAFNRPGWAFENKLDGFRALARREGDRVDLLSRTGRMIGANFPEVVSALKRIPGNWVIDGELVVPDARGHPSFEMVRRRGVMRLRATIAAAARETPAAYYVFDLLVIGARDVRARPLVERKEHSARSSRSERHRTTTSLCSPFGGSPSTALRCLSKPASSTLRESSART